MWTDKMQTKNLQVRVARDLGQGNCTERPGHRSRLFRSTWHLPHSEPYTTQMHKFPLNANLEATALPCQCQEGAAGQGILLAREARDPTRQAVHMGTNCHHIQAATSERF